MIAIVAILIGGGAGYLAGNANERTVTSTSTSTLTTPAAPPPYVNGLQLAIQVGPDDLTQGQNVTIRAWVYNPTSATIVVSTSGVDNPMQAPCTVQSGLGVNIYEGTYTFAFGNISKYSPLLQYNRNSPNPYDSNWTPSCIAPIQNTYVFRPYGANSNNETIVLGGYYTRIGYGLAYTFQPFPAGTYTVVVFDAWGQQALAHFNVASAKASAATPQNLRLSLTLNSTEFQPGEYVTMNASLTNMLSTLNNVTFAYQWPVKGLVSGVPCLQYPLGVAVLRGYYTAQNISAGTTLDMFKPGPPTTCPVTYLQYLVFQPESSNVQVNSNMKLQMNVTITISGYWTGFWNPPPGSPPATFHEFEAGTYTVVTGDEWGNLVLLHFSVA